MEIKNNLTIIMESIGLRPDVKSKYYCELVEIHEKLKPNQLKALICIYKNKTLS